MTAQELLAAGGQVEDERPKTAQEILAAGGQIEIPEDALMQAAKDTAPKPIPALQSALITGANTAALGSGPRVLAAQDGLDAVVPGRDRSPINVRKPADAMIAQGMDPAVVAKLRPSTEFTLGDVLSQMVHKGVDQAKTYGRGMAKALEHPVDAYEKFTNTYSDALPKYREGFHKPIKDSPKASFVGGMAGGMASGPAGVGENVLLGLMQGAGHSDANLTEPDLKKGMGEAGKLALDTGAGGALAYLGYQAPVRTAFGLATATQAGEKAGLIKEEDAFQNYLNAVVGGTGGTFARMHEGTNALSGKARGKALEAFNIAREPALKEAGATEALIGSKTRESKANYDATEAKGRANINLEKDQQKYVEGKLLERIVASLAKKKAKVSELENQRGSEIRKAADDQLGGYEKLKEERRAEFEGARAAEAKRLADEKALAQKRELDQEKLTLDAVGSEESGRQANQQSRLDAFMDRLKTEGESWKAATKESDKSAVDLVKQDMKRKGTPITTDDAAPTNGDPALSQMGGEIESAFGFLSRYKDVDPNHVLGPDELAGYAAIVPDWMAKKSAVLAKYKNGKAVRLEEIRAELAEKAKVEAKGMNADSTAGDDTVQRVYPEEVLQPLIKAAAERDAKPENFIPPAAKKQLVSESGIPAEFFSAEPTKVGVDADLLASHQPEPQPKTATADAELPLLEQWRIAREKGFDVPADPSKFDPTAPYELQKFSGKVQKQNPAREEKTNPGVARPIEAEPRPEYAEWKAGDVITNEVAGPSKVNNKLAKLLSEIQRAQKLATPEAVANSRAPKTKAKVGKMEGDLSRKLKAIVDALQSETAPLEAKAKDATKRASAESVLNQGRDTARQAAGSNVLSGPSGLLEGGPVMAAVKAGAKDPAARAYLWKLASDTLKLEPGKFQYLNKYVGSATAANNADAVKQLVHVIEQDPEFGAALEKQAQAPIKGHRPEKRTQAGSR